MRKYHPPLPFSPSSNKHWIASKILCALQTCPDCNLLLSTSEDLSRNTDTGPLQQSTFSDTTQKSSLVGQAQVRCIEKMDLRARSGNQTHRSSQTTGNKRADFFFFNYCFCQWLQPRGVVFLYYKNVMRYSTMKQKWWKLWMGHCITALLFQKKKKENKNHIPFSSVQNQKMLDFIYIKEK